MAVPAQAKLEPRPYHSCSDEERRLMLERVRVLEDRVVYYHELPVQTPFSIDVMMGKVSDLSAGWEKFGELLDLRDSERPDAETRARLRHHLDRLRGRLVHAAVVVGGNVIIRAVARLVAFRIGLDISVHDDEARALEAIRRAVR